MAANLSVWTGPLSSMGSPMTLMILPRVFGASVLAGLATDQTFSAVHGNSAHCVLPQVLSHLKDEPRGAVLHLQGIEDGGQVLIKLHVHNGANDGNNAADGHARCGLSSFLCIASVVEICRQGSSCCLWNCLRCKGTFCCPYKSCTRLP